MSRVGRGVVVRLSIVNRHTVKAAIQRAAAVRLNHLPLWKYWVARSSRAMTFVILETG